MTIWVLEGFRMVGILNVPEESHFRGAKKGVNIRVRVTIRGVTIWRLYSI